MRRPIFRDTTFRAALIFLAGSVAGAAQAPPAGRVHLRFETAEARAVLTILDAERSGRPASDTDWRGLFSSEGYVRLKAREAAMHRAFSDSDFAAFVRSDSLVRRASEPPGALSARERADVQR